MSPDDRFLPQGKQIFPKICQVRLMPKIMQSAYLCVIINVKQLPFLFVLT